MAIYRVAGQMLQSTLERDGNNIAFTNTANTTSVLAIDIANSRVGINSNVANVTLDVNGNIFALNLSSTGNITASNLNATVVSASGNVIGGNILTIGEVSATGNVTGGNINSINRISAIGNVIAGNVIGLDMVIAVGNLSGANITTTGLISATGNVTGGNITTAGTVSAVGNVNGNNVNAGNLVTATIVSATGNITGGNILTSGIISATGNLTSGNVNTTTVSATANVVAGNVLVGNILIPSTGNIDVGNVNINNLAEPFANSDAATKFYVDTTNAAAWGNLYVSNTTITTSLADGNITLAATGNGLAQIAGTAGFIIPVGNIDQRPAPPVTGTIRFNTVNTTLEIWDGTNWVSGTGDISVITNQTLNGDGSTTTFSLNQAATAESILVSINGIVQTPGVDYTTNTGPDEIVFTTAPASGDVVQVRFISTTTTVAALYNGTSNVNIPASNGNVTFGVGGTSNVLVVTSTGANITGYANVSGNLSVANLSISGNITGNLSGTLYTNSILNSGANLTGNIGNSTSYFNTVFAKATSAQYADLAEFYSADAVYEPGTVMSFGGDREITITNTDSDPCVAGVVSTNPSYIMNAGIFAEFPTQLALTGRVPCQVVGPVTKGAMMVSAGNGRARSEKSPAMGTVIGKALEAFDGDEGTIEIVVGRL